MLFRSGQIAEVKALLENATAQLESIKTDLSEKVHSENVKCYRNIQDLFNEFAVSYTHLDVYKRQKHNRAKPLFESASALFLIADADEFGSRGFILSVKRRH